MRNMFYFIAIDVLSNIWDASSKNLLFVYAKIKARFVSDLVETRRQVFSQRGSNPCGA